jgi:hypothetical protein
MSITRDTDRSDHLRAQLLGPRRYAVLGLDDVVEAGRIIFGDPEGMAFYGLAPSGWYARGVRLLGRTCVEATPDVTARPIARTVHALLGRRPSAGVVDLFVGSGNLMLHIAQALSAKACGLEAEEAAWRQTDANLRIIGAPTSVRLAGLLRGSTQGRYDGPRALAPVGQGVLLRQRPGSCPHRSADTADRRRDSGPRSLVPLLRRRATHAR